MFKSSSIKNRRNYKVLPKNQLSRGRSQVWKSFMVSDDRTRVACLLCGDLLSYTATQSTTGMWNHLKKKHDSAIRDPNMGMESFRTESFGHLQPTSPGHQHRIGNNPTNSKVEIDGDQTYSSQSHPDADERLTSEFSEQCVNMKWMDYKDSFLGFFTKLYHEERYTDVTLVAENVFFKAHRFMLSSASEFFDEMFSFAPDSTHPIIHLRGTKAAELQMLLDFIYNGEVTIPPSAIQDLVRIGTELKVRGLQKFSQTESREGEEHNVTASDFDQSRMEPDSVACSSKQNQFSDGTEELIISSDYARESDFLEFTKPDQEEESEKIVADLGFSSSSSRRRNRPIVRNTTARPQVTGAFRKQSSKTSENVSTAPANKARVDTNSIRIESVSGSILESHPVGETDPFRLSHNSENNSSSASNRPSCSWDNSQSAFLSFNRFSNQDILAASSVSSSSNQETVQTAALDTDLSRIDSEFPV